MALAPLHLSFSYLTLQETPGIQGILCPWRKKEGDSEWGSEGVGCRRKDNARGSTLFGFNKSPLPTLSTHTHFTRTSWLKEGVDLRAVRQCGVKGKAGERKKMHPTTNSTTTRPFSVFSGMPACPEPRFSHRERGGKTLLLTDPTSLLCIWLWHQKPCGCCILLLSSPVLPYCLIFDLLLVLCLLLLWINSSSLLLYICSFGCDSFWMKLYHQLRFSHLISQVWPHLA